MRNIKTILVLLVASAIAFSSCKKESGFTINGKINSDETGWVYLQKVQDNKLVSIDSVEVSKGAFTFKGKLEFPDMYYIKFSNQEQFLPIFLENSKINVDFNTENIESSKVTGSTEHALFDKYRETESTYRKQLDGIYENYKNAAQAGNEVEINRYENQYDSVENILNNITKDFIMQNPSSAVAPMLAWQKVYNYSLEELKNINNTLSKSLEKSENYQKLLERATILENVQVGKTAPDFTLNDTANKPVKLSEFKGKYVLLDFWASWCGPCRRENPNVVENFNKYNQKDFTVFGVSLDNNRTDWIEAIHHDKLTWSHVSDLQGWKNVVAKQYGVMSIPSSFLIDPNGVIIGKDLKGDELAKKLEEIFAEKE